MCRHIFSSAMCWHSTGTQTDHFPSERQQTFIDGLSRGFLYHGSVFHVIVFDNLTAAVEKVLLGGRSSLCKPPGVFQQITNSVSVYECEVLSYSSPTRTLMQTLRTVAGTRARF